MTHNRRNRFLGLLCLLSFLPFFSGWMVLAYGEIPVDTEFSISVESTQSNEYKSWLPLWKQEETDSGKVLLTPGSTEKDLNFSWYSMKKGTPAVMISTDPLYTRAKTVRGVGLSISRTNGRVTYRSANHVSVTGFLSEHTQYYYRYTDDIDSSVVEWSPSYHYNTKSFSSLSVILVGDPQIGLSDNIPADTFNWNRTLEQALKTAPEASFLMSAGDQINEKTEENLKVRESQYAGFLFPAALRSLPVAAAIGNHDTKGKDYRYHFHNPNSSSGYGSTPAGCDYYFSYGDTLFIVLNSNNRNMDKHRNLMKKAVSKYPHAKWRVALFHHDIYGSGAFHSNRTSANMRIIFAPLMDEFQIDLALNGHDHSYSRSYSMLDGTAIRSKTTSLLNPIGTTYVTLGSSSGSKMYGLANPKQFYVAERSNRLTPTFSTLNIAGNTLTLSTYDYTGKKYADDFQITKTAKRKNPMDTIQKAEKKKAVSYTKASYKKLARYLKKIRSLLKPSETDTGAEKVSKRFRKKNDPLSYYGYAVGTAKALPKGFSTLLDKTRIGKVTVSAASLNAAQKNLENALSSLKKTSLTVKARKKQCKNKTRLRLTEGKKLKLKIKKRPAKLSFTCHSTAKKYVTISKKGMIRAKKKRKKAVPVKIRFQNRTLTLFIQVI